MATLLMLAQLATALAFWISLASTEGWKWRQNDGRPDDSPVITWNTYHLWRSVTTAAFLVAPLVFTDLQSFLLANFVGWLCYERWMSLVEYGSLLYKRPRYHLVGTIWFDRAHPVVEAAAAGLAALWYLLRHALS